MMRIGQSKDMHRLDKGDYLRLGGIDIPSDLKAIGHSDADCLIHVISEALLGALALGDLGEHYPDHDSKYKGYDSTQMLFETVQKVEKNGYKIVNIDTLILLEKPRLSAYKAHMRKRISEVMNIAENQINIKATTGEKTGPIGKGELIVCEAIALIEKN